jgi:hypothetical protein
MPKPFTHARRADTAAHHLLAMIGAGDAGRLNDLLTVPVHAAYLREGANLCDGPLGFPESTSQKFEQC